MNIGTPQSPNIIKIGAQCSDQEKKKFIDLLQEFPDLFSWPYEDLRGFDPNTQRYNLKISVKTSKFSHKYLRGLLQS
jgi:hypothetical protein